MSGRRRPPNRRPHFAFEIERADQHITVGVGFFDDGRFAEMFMTAKKPGSAIGAAARDAAVAVSIAAQFGADLDTLRGAMTRLADGRAAGPAGAALDAIAAGEHLERRT